MSQGKSGFFCIQHWHLMFTSAVGKFEAKYQAAIKEALLCVKDYKAPNST